MKNYLKIETIDKSIADYFFSKTNSSFQIHSVFQSACNLFDDNGVWVTLVNQRRYLPPNGIRLFTNDDFRDIYKASKNIVLDYERHNIKVCDLSIGSVISVNIPIEKIRLKLEYIKAYLEYYGKEESLFKIKVPDKIEMFMVDLEKSINQNDINEIKRISENLIGFGKGLTPSMDDFLTGKILFWKAWKEYKPSFKNIDYSHTISCLSRTKTTLVSYYMMSFASEGRCSEELLDFMENLFTNVNGKDFENSLKEVIEIGSTSGEDLLFGIYSEGIRILSEYEGGNT